MLISSVTGISDCSVCVCLISVILKYGSVWYGWFLVGDQTSAGKGMRLPYFSELSGNSLPKITQKRQNNSKIDNFWRFL